MDFARSMLCNQPSDVRAFAVTAELTGMSANSEHIFKKDLEPMTSSRPETTHQRYDSLFILGYFSRNQLWKEKIQF